MCLSTLLVVQVRRCNEMSRRLRFFHEQVTGAEIPMAGATTDIGADLDELEVSGSFCMVHGACAFQRTSCCTLKDAATLSPLCYVATAQGTV